MEKMASVEKYFLKNYLELYKGIKKISQNRGESFAKVLEWCISEEEYKVKFKEKSSEFITQLDLEEIIENTDGGKETIRNISDLRIPDNDKVEIFRDYLTKEYSEDYLKSIWEAFQNSQIIPSVNAGVIEIQKPGNPSGYDDFITPELRDMHHLLCTDKAKKSKTRKNLEKLYAEALKRFVIKEINSKSPEEALKKIDKTRKVLKDETKKFRKDN